jgi:biopolymer transport protein TolR
MAMQLGGGGGIKADINVTPLVDVMLVLLIIVMLVAPLVQKGVDVRLPTATNRVDKPDTQDQVVVGITANGQLHLNSLALSDDELPDRAREALETAREKIVYLKADQDAQYGRVMAAMDALREAGIEDIGLIADAKIGSEEGGE